MKRKLKRLIRKIQKKKDKLLKKYSYTNTLAKKIYSNTLYKKHYIKHKEKILKQINIYYKEHSDKETLLCIKDMIYSKYVYGCTYAEYFMFKFMYKTHQERKKFICNKDRHMYLKYLNQNDFYNRFTDKYESYQLYKKYYKRDLIYIKSENDYDCFENFCLTRTQVVKKPVDSSLGKGIELLDVKGVDLKNLFQRIITENDKFILEERIVQSKEMAKLHPSSVNTIRIVPFMKNDGTVIIHCPFLKIGQQGAFVDNGGAGGILAAIDANSGKVISDGIDEKMNVYKKHPNTKEKIKGFQIPDWDGVIKLATKLVKEIPEARYVGWDFAHTPKGWIVVEGNGKTMFVGQQMPLDVGIKQELEELIDWKNVPNKALYKRKKTIK